MHHRVQFAPSDPAVLTNICLSALWCFLLGLIMFYSFCTRWCNQNVPGGENIDILSQATKKAGRCTRFKLQGDFTCYLLPSAVQAVFCVRSHRGQQAEEALQRVAVTWGKQKYQELEGAVLVRRVQHCRAKAPTGTSLRRHHTAGE